MRKKLGKLDNQRLRFRGTFERYGTKSNYHGYPVKTILLKNICLLKTGKKITEHLWFNHIKGFQALGTLEINNQIEFDARVKEYRKGYWGHNEMQQIENPPGYDWKLSHPTKIELVKE